MPLPTYLCDIAGAREWNAAMKVKERGNPSSTYSYRKDPSVPAFPDDRPIIIFDGHSAALFTICSLCSPA